MSHAKPRATDLKANEWAAISHYFPDMTFRSKGRKHAVKTLLNASLFRFENRLPLRQLALAAPDYPPWATVHTFEEKIKRQGLWLAIIQKIGRTYLLPVIQKMMRFAPQVSRLSLGRVRVLGRMVSPEVLRMAQADRYPYPAIGEPVTKAATPGWPDPTGETSSGTGESDGDVKPEAKPVAASPPPITPPITPPAEVTEPPIRVTHHGFVNGRPDGTLVDHEMAQSHDRKQFINRLLGKALVSPSGHAMDWRRFTGHDYDDYGRVEVNHDVVFVADQDGNVTAHHGDAVSRLPAMNHMHPDDFLSRAIISPQSPEAAAMRALHAEHAGRGNVYAKAHYATGVGHSFKPLLAETIKAKQNVGRTEATEYDKAPELIFADYLDERGYSRAAAGLRNRVSHMEDVAASHHPEAGMGHFLAYDKKVGSYPDAFAMLAKHEPTPDDARAKARLEGHLEGRLRVNPSEVPPSTARSYYSRNPSDLWRLSLGFARVLGRRVRLSPLRLSHGSHKKGCLHVNLPPDLAAQVLAFASQIPDDELHEEGRETCPHVTALYGFTDDKQGFKHADRLACDQAPVKGTLGKLAAFKKEDCDVLYVEVDSRDLARVNKVLKQKCRVASDYARYVPHATVAYLKPGASDKYVGLKDFDGKEFTCAYAVYSPAEGEDQLLAWCGKEGAEGEGAVRMAVEDEKTRDLGPPPAFEDRPTKQEAPHEPARRAGTSENLTPHVASPPPPPYTPTRKQREAMYGATPPTWAELSAADPAVMTVNRVGKNTYNDVRHVLMKDGRRYFWKNTDLAGKTGADFVRHERAGTMVAPHVESAVADTLRSLGFKDVPPHHVLRDHTGRAVGVLTPDVGGHSLADVYGGKSSYGRDHLQKVRAANRPEDVTRWLAASHMLNMDDRHNGNYHVGPDGEIIPLDFGFSLHPYRDDLVARKLDVPRSVTHQGKQRVVRWYGGPWATSHDALLGRGFVSPDAAVNPKDLGRFAIANRVLADRVAKTWESEGVPAEYVAKVHRELLERAKNAEAHAVNRSRLRLRDLPEKHRVSYGEPGISYQNMSAPDPDLWVHQWGNA